MFASANIFDRRSISNGYRPAAPYKKGTVFTVPFSYSLFAASGFFNSLNGFSPRNRTLTATTSYHILISFLVMPFSFKISAVKSDTESPVFSAITQPLSSTSVTVTAPPSVSVSI